MSRVTKDEYFLDIALAVSKRSSCIKRHYGCIIVKNNEIIATGYNGSPRGEENCCDRRECKRLSVPHNSGDYSSCHSVHAEQNAMLEASRKDMIDSTLYLVGEEQLEVEFFGCSPWMEIAEALPCPICLRMMKNAGITRIVNRRGSICL